MEAVKNSILDFPQQLTYQPVVENAGKLVKKERFTLIGMGGSRLAADLLRSANPEIDLSIHADYGLPRLPQAVLENSFLIFCSYSGNTEEVLDGFEEALKAGLAVGVIAAGGKLIERAKETGVPYICLPDWQLVPRLAVGLMLKALVVLLDLQNLKQELETLTTKLTPAGLESVGQDLAKSLEARVPIIYTSAANAPLAWIWKIKFNETAKVPAFANVLPEQNHNELEGFDSIPVNSGLSGQFSFVFLTDSSDNSRIKRRFEILNDILSKKGLPVTTLELKGESKWEKFFNSLTLSDWTTLALAEHYQRDPASVPLIEEFKKLMAN